MDLNPAIMFWPLQPAVPYVKLLSRWRRAEMEPRACRAIVEELIAERPELGPCFDPAEVTHGGMVATRELLHDSFLQRRGWRFINHNRSTGQSLDVELADTEMSDMVSLLRDLRKAGRLEPVVAAWRSAVDPQVIGSLLRGARARSFGRWAPIDRPGIYRREHASLVLRSSTTTLVTDPQSLSVTWTTNGGRSPEEPEGRPADAVLITHTHDDHWDLASLLHHAPSPSIPVVVPQLTASLLCRDILAEAELAGQQVLAPAWGSTITIGDFEIEVLPFYGEQPVRRAPGVPGGMRNWGNCYRVRCPEFSALLMADAGEDPAGSMVDAVQRSVEERGPVDVVLSSSFVIPEVLNPGLPYYCLAIPFERARATFAAERLGRQESITLGPQGVARICQIARARYYLPYAHGFRGIGVPPRSVEGGLSRESCAIADVASECARIGGATQVVPWLPGAVARIDAHRLIVEPASPGR